MTTSKYSMKIMSFIMALALIVSLLYAPGAGNTAKASDTATTGAPFNAPKVTVLGASIKFGTSSTDGKQAMKVAIRVDNADNAASCAISFALESRIYTVATDDHGDVKQPLVYSKNVTEKTVVYVAIISDIEEKDFASEVSIIGKAWGFDGTMYQSDASHKSVNDIVNEINNRYPGMNVTLENGTLYKNTGERTVLSLSDFDNVDPINGPTATPPSDNTAAPTSEVVTPTPTDTATASPTPPPTATPTASPTPSPTPVSTPLPKNGFYAVRVPTGSSVTIDGREDESWANAVEYPFLYYSGTRARNSSTATIKLMWDDTHMYGIFDVYDARIDSSNENDWEKDGIEIFFDEDNSKEEVYGMPDNSNRNTDAFQYRCSGLSSPSPARPLANGFSKATETVQSRYSGLTNNVKAAANGPGYKVEFAIPLYRRATLGRVVGFDATVMDAQDGVRNNEMWFTGVKPVGDTVGLYHNASLFANVMFVNPEQIEAAPVNTPLPNEPEGCIAHFTFDDETREGYNYRSLDGNAVATVIGSISGQTDAISGKAISMAEGSASYLKVKNADGSALLDGKDSVTISYWSKLPRPNANNSLSSGWAFYAGRKGITLGALNRYYLGVQDRYDKYSYEIAKNGGRANAADNMGKGVGQWNNVTVVVRDNGDKTTTSYIYVNGEISKMLNGIDLASFLGTGSDFFIGSRPWTAGAGADYFKGYMDDFAVFDRALSSDEVRNYVNSFGVELPTAITTPAPKDAPFEAQHTTANITVDGIADDAWANVPSIPFKYYSVGKRSTDASIKLMWSDTYMYALIDVADPYIDRSGTDPWEDDGIEVFYDEDASGEVNYEDNYDAFQYRYTGFTSDGATATFNAFASASTSATSIYSGRRIAYKPIARGYAVEVAIPFYYSPEVGKVIGFDISVMDCFNAQRNNEIWFTGPAKDQMYQDASLMGRVKLAAAKALNPVPAQGRPDVDNIDSCIAYFTLDELSGGAYLSENGGAKATVVGNRLSRVSDAVAGNAVSMPEYNNSYLKVTKDDGTSLLTGSDALTISYWSKIPDESSDAGWIFFAKDSEKSADDPYTIALRDQFDRLRFQRANQSGDATSAQAESVAASHPQSVPGEWKNVTVVIDHGNTDLYVNGELAANQTGITPDISTYIKDGSELFIGYAPNSSGGYYQGYVDEFAIMDKAYSANEVKSYYNSYVYQAPLPTATPEVRILSCSDYQIWYWDNNDYQVHDDRDTLQPQAKAILEGAKDAGFDNPDFFLFGGDFTSTHDEASQDEGMTQLKNLVYGTWTNLNDDNSLYIQGNHDESVVGTHGLAETGAHEYDKFIIYALNDDAYPSTQATEGSDLLVQDTADNLAAYLQECVQRQETRPVFIAAHAGLHYDIDRQDGNNQYAYIIFNTLNDYADDLDIIYLFGHNHSSGDEIVGGSITCLTRGDRIEVSHEDSITNKAGTLSTLKFTYMNYGYIGNVGDIYNNTYHYAPWLTNLLVVNSINIFPDRITVDRFSKDRNERKYHTEIPRMHGES